MPHIRLDLYIAFSLNSSQISPVLTMQVQADRLLEEAKKTRGGEVPKLDMYRDRL